MLAGTANPVENLPQGHEEGKARDKAGEAFGISGKLFDAGSVGESDREALVAESGTVPLSAIFATLSTVS